MQHIALPLVIALLEASEVPPAPHSITIAAPEAAGRELRPDFLVGPKCRDAKLPTADNPGQQPRFERGPATADMGQYIYAVDRRIDGCSVVLTMSPSLQPRVPLKPSAEEMAEIRRRR
ncbi:hypothetical protein [Erythrobacter donghaensis]|jgi:hypothetical protein|uniref:hypothetical protein n=1 Tax=Erythrobacter donghaensis TaxID=267135 RepID=UPI00093A64D2|nr:hypothetical protein [Erythrobacter donghaensis]